jgi:uncharacterized protein (TIGR00725 family)
MNVNEQATRISVIGGSKASQDMRDVAEQAGRRIAERGAILVCGGMGGVMEAACRGAKQAGGTTVGIVPTRRADDANPHVDIPIVTGMGDARNVSVALSGMGIIAIDGRFGTLSEMALGLNANRPLAAINAPAEDEFSQLDNVHLARSADDAVSWMFEQIT